MKILTFVLVLTMSGCGFVSGVLERDELTVQNLDGPPVTVNVNGKPITELVCQFSEGKFTLQLAPDASGLPALPWSVTLVEEDGAVFGSWQIDRLDGAKRLLIRNGGGVFGEPGPAGPAPMSNPGCPGAGLQES